MFYIHQSSCISPQHTFADIDIDHLQESENGQLTAVEPAYPHIPPGVLRRMGKAVRMAVGAALPLLSTISQPDGIIIATANGGKEDGVKFIQQLVKYEEGLLTPIHFVQSTPNAIAAQIGLLTKNHGYNITHSQPGAAFENAAIDAAMFINEDPESSYLLGAVDDISSFNASFEAKTGLYKSEIISSTDLFESGSAGSIAGEAVSMFIVNGKSAGAAARLLQTAVFYETDVAIIREKLQRFLQKYLPESTGLDLLMSGENGDRRLMKYFDSCESSLSGEITVARYKHMSGEYPSAAAMALWLCCRIFQTQSIPAHMIKRSGSEKVYRTALIYNCYRGSQHSFMLVSTPD